MRLLSATVNNYRIHKSTHVTFGPELTLISGPNESGKSTLAEAIHRALFLKAKTSGTAREKMNSDWGGYPEIHVEFVAGGKTVLLKKLFHGSKSSCQLSVSGEQNLSGDAAEEKLAELLKVGGSLDGKSGERLDQRWAHLWVRQGLSGGHPGKSVFEQKDALMQRLRSQGGTAVMQSDLDARVLDAIRKLHETIYTTQNKERKESDVQKAANEMENLRKELQTERDALESRRDAAVRLARFRAELAEKKESLSRIRSELGKAEQRRRDADGLIRDLEPLKRAIDDIDSRLSEIEEQTRELTALEKELNKNNAEIRPMESGVAELKQENSRIIAEILSTEKRLSEARNTLNAASRLVTALADRAQELEIQEKLTLLLKDRDSVSVKRRELEKIGKDISDTPDVKDGMLKELGQLQKNLSRSEGILDAMGAKIELIRSELPVIMDGKPLSAGESTVIIGDAELEIGEKTSLRIRPGGLTDIAAERRKMENTQERIAAILSEAGVRSVEEAEQASERMKILAQKKKSLLDELDRLGAPTIEESVRDTEEALSRISRRSTAARESGIELPDSREKLDSARGDADDKASMAAEVYEKTEGELKELRDQGETFASRLLDAETKLRSRKESLQNMTGRFQQMRDKYGSAEARCAEIAALSERRTGEAARHSAVKEKISLLQPEFIDDDIVRLKQSIEQTLANINTAISGIGGAETILRLSGTDDPEGDFERAKARFELAEARHDELKKDAVAVRHLREMAEKVQKGLAEKFAMPLEAAAGRYLSCMFGTGSSLRINFNMEDNMFSGILVGREEAGLGNFDFESLSGGAKEQIGIAMRLAMAEVLAVDHDGCLPVVLDDSFTSSDPERVELIQRMLFNAARNGLQIIVFSCNPADYRTLGAAECRLIRPGLPAVRSTDEAYHGPGTTENSPDADARTPDPADESFFMEKLAELGGTAGNGKLRETLGWDEETFETIKGSLLESGRILPGKGRGGSVKLLGTES